MKPRLLRLRTAGLRRRARADAAAGKPAPWLRLTLRWRGRLRLAGHPWKPRPLQQTWHSHVAQHFHTRGEALAPVAAATAGSMRYRAMALPLRRTVQATALARSPEKATRIGSAAAERSLREPQREPARELRPVHVHEKALVHPPVPRVRAPAARMPAVRSVREPVVGRSMQVRTSLLAIERQLERRTTELRYARRRADDGRRGAVPAALRLTAPRTPARDPGPRAQGGRPSPLPLAGSAPMVWRVPTAAPAGASIGMARDPVVQPAREAVSTAPLARTPGRDPGAEVPARAVPPLRATALDPALADRLADDVVRRVEKRLRIERERRGL